MANVKTAYGTSNQALTITLINLANNAARQSTAIDNTSNLWLDVLISAKFGLTSGTAASPNAVMVYAYASVDGGASYPDAATGTDGGITLASPTQLKLLGAVYAPTQSAVYKGGPWSLAALYGGRMPAFWGVVALNQTGIALDATAGNQAVVYQGVYATVT